MDKNKIMMSFFVGSEAFFFLALIISYLFYSHQGGVLSSTAQYLDFKRTLFFTFFLLSSSLTVEYAISKGKQGKKKQLIIALLTTMLFGLIFLVGQSTEYLMLFKLNITISKDVFSSAFFTLTGFHGFHVLVGLIVLSIVAGMIMSGKFKIIETTAFESVAIYWHFVDVVWIAVFSVVYIGAIV
jgi:cytochrome c oxidase subunit III